MSKTIFVQIENLPNGRVLVSPIGLPRQSFATMSEVREELADLARIFGRVEVGQIAAGG